MARRYRTPDDPPSPAPKATLARLIEEWDGKLAAEGFRDIESRKHDRLMVRRSPETTEEATRLQEGAAYLGACTDYLRANTRYMKPGDRVIWRLHSQGLSDQAVADEIGKSKSWVDQRVRRTRVRMLRWNKRRAQPGQGLGRDSARITTRFSDREVTAIHEVAEAARFSLPAAIRALVLVGADTMRQRLNLRRQEVKCAA